MQRLDLCVVNRVFSIVILTEYLSETENLILQNALKDSHIQFIIDRRINHQLVSIQSYNYISFAEINNFNFINGLKLPNKDRIVEKDSIYKQNLNRCYSIIYYDDTLGWGIQTNENIEMNTILLPYYGEVISTNEAKTRSKMNKDNNKMNYILTIREHIPQTVETKAGVLVTNIDASTMGSIARYVNHSCAPNCHITMIRPHGSVLGVPVLQSIRHIQVNEPITFDYGHSEFQSTTTSGTASSSRKCLCGAVQCRGYLPFFSY